MRGPSSSIHREKLIFANVELNRLRESLPPRSESSRTFDLSATMSKNHVSITSPPNNNAVPTPPHSSFSGSRSPHSRNPSLHLAHMPSAASQHRQSFSESLRGLPPSPRAQRQPSFSQLAVQELIDNPPVRNDPVFAGRDWRTVDIAELVSPEDLKFAEVDTGVEAATNVGRTCSDLYLTCSWIIFTATYRLRGASSSHPRESFFTIRHRDL
jgi:hypothetical protein